MNRGGELQSPVATKQDKNKKMVDDNRVLLILPMAREEI